MEKGALLCKAMLAYCVGDLATLNLRFYFGGMTEKVWFLGFGILSLVASSLRCMPVALLGCYYIYE